MTVDPKEVKVTVKVNSASEDTGTTEENTTKTQKKFNEDFFESPNPY